MSRRYSIAEARANLPDIVDQAAAGLDVELTRRGKPVAVVVSLREFERLRGSDRPRFSDASENFLETYSLDEIGFNPTSSSPFGGEAADGRSRCDAPVSSGHEHHLVADPQGTGR